MKIIISPAKKMNQDTDSLEVISMPVFPGKTETLMKWIKGLSREEAKALWKCNDKLTDLNFRRFSSMNLCQGLTPAVLSYEGIQYQYMAPSVMEQRHHDYIQKNLRILSGFYGVLKPFDGVVPYLKTEDMFVTCVFGELKEGKVIQKGTMAKMARGEMVKFLAERDAQGPEDAKKFDRLGYCFREELSSENEYVFLKEG